MDVREMGALLVEVTVYPKRLGGQIGFAHYQEEYWRPEDSEDADEWVEYDIVGLVIG